ncbi:MAG: FAD-binding monooxygenase [Cyanobacteria bacterium P01_F01_bin.150]
MPNGEGSSSSSTGLPEEILEAIAVSNAKSIGEQPAILSNLALANEIANVNLSQQNALSNQQAMFQLQYATIAKCVEIITSIDPNSEKANSQIEVYKGLMNQLMSIMGQMNQTYGDQNDQSSSHS